MPEASARIISFWTLPTLLASSLLARRSSPHFGAVDILVSNAGIAFREPAEETSEDKWDLTMAVNLKAVFLLSKAVGRYFLDQGHGKIVKHRLAGSRGRPG